MKAPALIILLVSLTLIGYQIYRYSTLNQELIDAQNEFASSTLVFADKLKNLQTDLTKANQENIDLNDSLTAERDRNDNFEDQINNITDKVGVLDKLSKTDPQLLLKYSKIFFLNEHYVPPKLTEIEAPYSYQLNDQSKPEQILTDVWPYLKDLLTEATRANINLQIISGYRSFGEQTSLKSGYKFIYGAGTANQFSADQGYSEHQLGTTVDFTTIGVGASFKGFELTPAYQWLTDNAHKYGFTLSYPKGNNYYLFEPWHWRFVGVKLATKLQRDNQHFYDLNQRTINQYLIDLFD
jgi:D-alanyl-D-alanine carboxypeptidase